jgi:hypothetical protein
MRKFIFILILVFISSCATQQTTKLEESPPPALTSSNIPVQTPGTSLQSSKKTVKPSFGELINNVTTSKSSFNPTQKENVTVSFKLSQSSKINVNIYDTDKQLVQTLVDEKTLPAGQHDLIWNGKDLDGQIVPDEAYFFTLIARDNSGKEEVYDPTIFSGGIEHDIISANIDRQSHTVTYTIPEMGRVLIRIGIQGGPLMNTLVDWQPRVKGFITEYWNGKDKDDIVDIYDHPKFKMIITYFNLPENSVIAFGNKGLNFRDYKKTIAKSRPLKPERPSSIQKLSHHYRLPRTEDYSPEVQMTLVNAKGTDDKDNVILENKTIVKVDLDKKDRQIFQNQQFEIVFFLDYEFYAEDEAGYTPFNWVWDLSNVEEGEHLLTVNVSSFKDQIGVLSRKVKVIKE